MFIKRLKILLLILPLATHAAPSPSIQPQQIPAIDQQEAIVQINELGFYAIEAKSKQGTAISVIDRMQGPSAMAGKIGEQNGRINVLLDRGEYKLIAQSSENGSGNADLSITQYKELNTKVAPRLPEHKLVSTSLHDYQQRSYWLEIKQRRTVHLEAAGRNLADMRLWLDGNWLIDAIPQKRQISPTVGRDLQQLLLVADLQPGLYLLTAYGGETTAWAQEGKNHPFYLRYGIPELGKAGRNRFIASPLGIDRWKIPAETNFVQLELAQAQTAGLRVNSFSDNNPFAENGSYSEITKDSRVPLVSLQQRSGSSNAWRIITVTREANQAYVLQHFVSKHVYELREQGSHRIAVLQAGHAGDNLVSTPMIYRNRNNNLVADLAIKLDSRSHYKQTFNLLQTLTLYLNIEGSGSFKFSEGESEAKAEFRLEPLFLYGRRPNNYRTPDFRDSGVSWDVDSGYYLLSIRPKTKGILDLIIKGESYGNEQNLNVNPVFPSLSLGGSSRVYTLQTNQVGVPSGLLVESLPIQLKKAIPVTLSANSSERIPIRVAEAGSLVVVSDDGTVINSDLNGKQQKKHELAPGDYDLTIENKQAQSLFLNIQFQAEHLNITTPLPAMDTSLLTSLPEFPTISAEAPQFFDLERDSWKIFTLKVKEPGLYRLESSGLLSTKGILRSRLDTRINNQSEKDVGRNFLVQQYLRPGDYQVRVQTEGKTKGHLGLHLNANPIVEGGQIHLNDPARASLSKGTSIRYLFYIKEPGEYQIVSEGLNRIFQLRLEDNDGWPLIQPGVNANITRYFRPGWYQIVLLPPPLETRVVTRITPVLKKAERVGHGPHHLELNKRNSYVWQESDQRSPDVWQFELTAAADVTIAMTQKMQATLIGEKQSFDLPKRKTWTQRLDPGRYKIAMRSIRRDNQLEYFVNVSTKQLTPGQERSFAVPSTIDISNNDEQMLELSSFGAIDVKAILLDQQGKMLAKNDDREHDWNFLIQKKLPKGFYRLKIESAKRGNTKIAFRTPQVIQHQPLTLPTTIKLNQANIHSYPIKPVEQEQLLIASVSATTDVGFDVEVQRNGIWQSLSQQSHTEGYIAVALQKNTLYRLRAWSLRSHDIDASIHVAGHHLSAINEKQLSKGIDLKRINNGKRYFRLALVETKSAGIFSFKQAQSVLWSNNQNTLRHFFDPTMALSKGKLWLLSADNIPRLNGHRVRIDKDDDVSVKVYGKEKVSVDLVANKYNTVLIASSLTGIPALGLDYEALNHAAFNEKASLLFIPKTKAESAKLWIADGQEELSVRLQRFNTEAIKPLNIDSGISDFSLGSMKNLRLQSKSQASFLLSLPLNTGAAILNSAGKVIDTFWAKDTPKQISVKNGKHRVIVFNLNMDAAQIQITGFSEAEQNNIFTSDKPYSRLMTNRSTFTIPIAISEQHILHVNGSIDKAWFVSEKGEMFPVVDQLQVSKGKLIVDSKPGWVVAALQAQAAAALKIKAKIQTLPFDLRLSGKSKNIQLNLKKDTMLHLSSSTPMLMERSSADGDYQFVTAINGLTYNHLLLKGSHNINLYALTDQELQGTMRAYNSTISTLKEGLNKKRLLPPGQSRLFQFTVQESTRMGVGIQAEQDVLDCTLYDSQGRLLGEGVVQLHELDAGKYYLSVNADSHVEHNVGFRVALVGLSKPTSGPPEEVIKKYMKAFDRD